MSPREASYQYHKVDLPEDHLSDLSFDNDDLVRKPERRSWRQMLPTLALVPALIVLLMPRWCAIRLLPTHVVMRHQLLRLNASLEGPVLFRENDGFVEAARVWRQDLELPAAVIEVATERDVRLAVPLLSELGVPFRIRSGGHSKAGYSTVEGGIVLSLKRLKERTIVVDNPNHFHNQHVLAKMEPGSTVEDVLDAFLDHTNDGGELYGGALGQCGKVAEGGWVLGGGVGFMARLLGLGIDNVLEFRVVLADGSLVVCNSQEHPDLFWALRGAGQGSYGVVTSMTYQLHRMPDTQLFQQIMIPYTDLSDFLYRLGALNTDGEFFVVVGGRDGGMIAAYLSWFSLEPDATHNTQSGQQHFEQEIRPLLPPSAVVPDAYQPFPWAESTHLLFDQGYGTSVYAAQPWQGFLMPVNNTQEVWDDIMDTMAKGFAEAPDLEPHIELWGGAIGNVEPVDTAFPYRDAVYNVGVLLVVQEHNSTAQQRFEEQVAMVNRWWPLVAQYLTGSYLNYPMKSLEAEEYPRHYWGEHLERLVEIKREYDPNNAFHFEQSVPMKVPEL